METYRQVGLLDGAGHSDELSRDDVDEFPELRRVRAGVDTEDARVGVGVVVRRGVVHPVEPGHEAVHSSVNR